MAERKQGLSVVCLSLSSKLRIKSSLGPYPCNSPKVVLSFHVALVRGGALKEYSSGKGGRESW